MAMNSFGMRPGIILLREGTDSSQGKPQLISNINACQAVADAVRTTLGPAGRDKLVATTGRVTISNDGATLLRLLEIAHPAAKTLVDISMSQDAAIGDGTTSVVLLAAEILRTFKPLIEEGIHPQVLLRNLRLAGNCAVQTVKSLSMNFSEKTASPEMYNAMLLKTASTALNSKLIANHKDLFAPMVVQAVQSLHEGGGLEDLQNLIAIKQIPGGDVRSSFLVQGGVAFRKTFSYAGFEQMNKRFENPKILLLNVELELKAEKENAEVRISDPAQYQSIVDAEWQVIFDKLQACIDCGANIVLSKLPIGDVATQYFCDRNLFCAGRVPDADLKRVAKATRATIQTSTRDLTNSQATHSILGTCGLFEEKQVGDERFNVLTNCPEKLTSTIVLRGGTEQFIAESERSIHDALMVVKRTIQSGSIVAGGGAIEMQVSKALKDYARTVPGKGQWVLSAYSKALEVIPRQLCENAGFDSTDILAALRRKHALTTTTMSNATTDQVDNNKNSKWYGVDLVNGDICDTFEAGIWEPCGNKINCFEAATEAACLILSIDETIVAPRSQDPGAAASGMMGNNNKPMSNMMNSAMEATQGGARTGQLGPGVSYMKGRG